MPWTLTFNGCFGSGHKYIVAWLICINNKCHLMSSATSNCALYLVWYACSERSRTTWFVKLLYILIISIEIEARIPSMWLPCYASDSDRTQYIAQTTTTTTTHGRTSFVYHIWYDVDAALIKRRLIGIRSQDLGFYSLVILQLWAYK